VESIVDDIAETIARQLHPTLWARWDNRANRHAMSERILEPLVNESRGEAGRVIALYERIKSGS
jgi:hypothetical protein